MQTNCFKLVTGPNEKASQSEEKRAEVQLPDVKQSAPDLVIDRVSSPYLGNVETNRNPFRKFYNCVIS